MCDVTSTWTMFTWDCSVSYTIPRERHITIPCGACYFTSILSIFWLFKNPCGLLEGAAWQCGGLETTKKEAKYLIAMYLIPYRVNVILQYPVEPVISHISPSYSQYSDYSTTHVTYLKVLPDTATATNNQERSTVLFVYYCEVSSHSIVLSI